MSRDQAGRFSAERLKVRIANMQLGVAKEDKDRRNATPFLN